MKRTTFIIGCTIALTITALALSTYSKRGVPRTFKELTRLSDDEIATINVARMNLLCAKGLPGAEDLDIEECLAKLEHWAEHVKIKEIEYAPAFQPNRAKYKNSYNLFRGAYLGIAIEQDFGCGYNELLQNNGEMDDLSSTRFFSDASDIFIHGLIQQKKGTCSSLPVLMLVLGRKCDYPLQLVACGGHLFNRWDDGSERFNLEITCKGVNSHTDEHYLKWPRPISEKEIAEENLMHNLSNLEILGVFAGLRSACLQEHGRLEEALESEKVAERFLPNSRLTRLRIKRLKKHTAKGTK